MTDSTFHLETILDDLMRVPRLPRATYRLQFSADFTFHDAAELVDYLHDLGASHLYASPLFKPRTGSTHGYDTVDYNQLNPVLGTDDDLRALSEQLKALEMGILLDIVPNHMGVNTENVWWTDVLKQGPSSVYADYFDIDWQPQNRALDNKVLLPVLGDHYGRVLESGLMKVVYWHGDFYVHYYEHQFPLTPETYVDILRCVHEKLLEDPGEDWVQMELASVIHALRHMPPYTHGDPESVAVRQREQIITRWRLLGLFDKSEAFRNAMTAGMEVFNGDPADPATFDRLDAVLSGQPYRLSYWRVASDEINYRRFFDINDMAAIRIEDEQVFHDAHRLTLSLLAEGLVDGLRIDHADGLLNPQAYFTQLQEEYLIARIELETGQPVSNRVPIEQRLHALAASSTTPPEWPLYVLVEKILSETEPLPYSWAVYGTTGYEFLNAANSLFVDPDNEAAFDVLYNDFIDETLDFDELIDTTKKLLMAESLNSEIESRSALLARIIEKNRRYRGFTRNSLAFALSEFTAALSVYRTYITGPGDITERDRHYIEEAIKIAKQRNPLVPTSIFDFLRNTLLAENLGDFTEDQRAELREFVMKFQQITGPVMAKSVEDTAFYIYNRLTSLNEVGGHPDQFGHEPEDFHRHNTAKAFPHTMLCSSTHDTKRSEDVRARINALSEMPDTWREKINEWATTNAGAKTMIDEFAAPSRNDEYLLYQTLLGAFTTADAEDLPGFRARIIAYMHKAINEAKTHSNWVNPNDDYAQAIADFVTAILDDDSFRTSFDPFQQQIAFYGYFNSLAMTLLKLTVPGIPDIYQGNELWDFSLVDPDNRRPVDFALRREILAKLNNETAAGDRLTTAKRLVDEIDTGEIKLYVTHAALNHRREHPDLYLHGDYQPLTITGAHARHVCAYLRRHEDAFALVVVPRLVTTLTHGEMTAPTGMTWGDTRVLLPDDINTDALINILTGESFSIEHGSMALADLLQHFPVALVTSQRPEDAG